MLHLTLINTLDVTLPHSIEGYSIALVEANYYPRWYNISKALGNNTLVIQNGTVTIPDGYYNVCSLNAVLKPTGLELIIDGTTGYLRLGGLQPNQVQLSPGLIETLGLDTGLDGSIKPHQLAIHKEISLHLKELSTTENVVNGLPSTLLQFIPVGNEGCGSGKTWSPINLQYKRLRSGVIPNLSFEIRGSNGDVLQFDYLRLCFELKQW